MAARLWDATEGAIEVGGVNIATVDPEVLLSDYSMVFQTDLTDLPGIGTKKTTLLEGLGHLDLTSLREASADNLRYHHFARRYRKL